MHVTFFIKVLYVMLFLSHLAVKITMCCSPRRAVTMSDLASVAKSMFNKGEKKRSDPERCFSVSGFWGRGVSRGQTPSPLWSSLPLDVCKAHPLNKISLCSSPHSRRAHRWCQAQEIAPVPKAATLSIRVKMRCTQESAWPPRPKWRRLWDRIPGVPWLWRDSAWGKLDPGAARQPPDVRARFLLQSSCSGRESAGKDHSSEIVFVPWWQRCFSAFERGSAEASSSSYMQEKHRESKCPPGIANAALHSSKKKKKKKEKKKKEKKKKR